MSGKHRASKHRTSSRGRSPVVRRGVPGLTAAAVSAASVSTALMTGTTATVAAVPVELAALITPANSTSQIFAGTTYYGTDWTTKGYGQQQVVPFFLGPQGIVNAIDANSSDPSGVVVLSSGWGAGQTSTALAIMQANQDPALKNVKLVVLDNNTNRAGGGFWTTYPMLAPFLLTSAAPTPSNTTVPVVDTAYEYNINSDAPTYPINLLADANSLVAYAYGYGAQSTAPMPAEALQAQPSDPVHYHYVVAPDGKSYTKTPVPGNITYVTFQSDGLPLVRPLRSVPGGNVLADAVEPTLTVLVNWGYQDNSPIPQNPGVTRPAGLLPPASQTVDAANQLPGAVGQGVQAAQKDLSSPSSLVTSPLSSVTTTVGAAAGNLPSSSLPSVPKLTTPLISTVDMTGGNRVSPRSSTTSTSSSGGANPVQQVAGSVSSALSGLAGSLTNGARKGATTSTASGASGSSG
jgi:hypothetical protein